MRKVNDNTKSSFKALVNAVRNKLIEDLRLACNQRYSLTAKDIKNVKRSFQEQLEFDRLFEWLNDPCRVHKNWKSNLDDLIKERAYTLTNRLVILMQLESRNLRSVKLISNGVTNSAFKKEQEFFVDLTQGNDAGFNYILQQVWDHLALDLPALFEYNEIHECIHIPGTTLLLLIDELNKEELKEAWLDDTTLGWLYQFWNDPDRKAVDYKLNNSSGKVEAHELSDKTQLFTERYMVEWLVQNSLGAQWLAICSKNGWSPEANRIIDELKVRRTDWNKKIDNNEVLETEPMPTSGKEEFWKYYVPQDIAQETINASPNSLEEVKVLDPAMGSGHFLVYVFDFLFELYHDQANLNNTSYSPKQIVDFILNNNLHGIDIDNRAVQIGAAALYIKAQEKVDSYKISKLNLVASDLGLSHLEQDDLGVMKFTSTLEEELNINKDISYEIIKSLKGAEYLGSLLQVDKDIKKIVDSYSFYNPGANIKDVQQKVMSALSTFIHDHDNGEDLGVKSLAEQLGKGLRLIELLLQKYDIVVGNPPYLSKGKVCKEIEPVFIDGVNELYEVFVIYSKKWLRNEGILAFLTAHNFMFIEKFKAFRDFIYCNGNVKKIAQLGVWAFSEVTQSGALGIALFIWQKSFCNNDIATFQRIGSGQHKTDPKFEDKIGILMSQLNKYTFLTSRFSEIESSPMIYWWPEEFRNKYLKSSKLSDVGEVKLGMSARDNKRFVYIWHEIELYKINISYCGNDESLNNTISFTFQPYLMGANGKRWFAPLNKIQRWSQNGIEAKQRVCNAYPYLKGNYGFCISNESKFFVQGISFSYIGTDGFLCSLRKYNSIFDVSGSSIFCSNPEEMQVILSSSLTGYITQSLNPTVNNQVGDIAKIPVLDFIEDYTVYLNRAKELYDRLFSSNEANIEYQYSNVSNEEFEIEEARIRDDIDKEFMLSFSQETVVAIYKEIGTSAFNYPLWDGLDSSIPPKFEEMYQEESSILKLSRKLKIHPDSILTIKDYLGLIHEGQRKDNAFKDLSWTIGVLLGRFDAQTGGLVDLAEKRRKELSLEIDPNSPKANSHGIFYLSSLDDYEGLDRPERSNVGNSFLRTIKSTLTYKHGEEKCEVLWKEIEDALVLDCKTTWTPAQRAKKSLNQWIREKGFDMHCSLYEKRPIYFPLTSAKKNFVLWVNIHRWEDGTLNSILANYLKPDITILDNRIKFLREERQHLGDDKKQLDSIENEISKLSTLLDELKIFTGKIEQLATKGPNPDLQEVEVPYVMDLDDGVMVNSSALWEVVNPVWKDPKKWWTSLSAPKGKKDFDWSHLAMRYWPNRVMEKVKKDPSLAVAHSNYGQYKDRDLFTELHPAAAKKWEEQQEASKQKELELG